MLVDDAVSQITENVLRRFAGDAPLSAAEPYVPPRATLPAQPTRVRWFVLAFIAFAVASAYLTRYCISAANTTMQQDLGFDDAQMGQLISAFMLGYFLSVSFPEAGWEIDSEPGLLSL